MRLTLSLPIVLPMVLLGLSCRVKPPAPVEPPSHIRIEPSRSPNDPLRTKQPTGAATPEEVGIVFYPGATVQDSSLVRDARGVTAAVRLATRDAYQEVLNFYADKYRSRAEFVKLDSPDGHAMALNWRTRSGNFTIEIKQDTATKQTLIHLVRLTGSKSSPARKRP